MAFDSNGKWSPEDDSVASKIASITAGDSPMMQQAATTGVQTANRRGLGNSSMAIGAAQGEVIRAAAPIASQEASQVASKNLAEMGNRQQTDITQRQIAAQERERIAASLTDLSSQRMNATSQTLANDKIPAATRSAVQQSFNDQYTSTVNYLQNLYGVSVAPTTPTPAPAYTGLGYAY